MLRLILLRFLESYFRHRFLHLVPIAMMAVAAGVFLAISPLSYSTSGKLYVERGSLLASLTATSQDGSWWLTAAQLTTNEINELLGTQAFVRSVVQKTRLEAELSGGPDQIEQVFATVRRSIWLMPRGDKLLEIGANTEDPDLARELVTGLMDAYIQWKLNTDYQESVAAQAFFNTLIPSYQENLDKARADLVAFLNNYPEPVRGDRPADEAIELDRLTQIVSQAEERLNSALANEENARLSLAKSESVTRQTYLLIDQAELPRGPTVSLRRQVLDAAIFVGVGVVLSIFGVVASALLDRSIRFPIDARQWLSLATLAALPEGKVNTATLEHLEREQDAATVGAERAKAAQGDPALQA